MLQVCPDNLTPLVLMFGCCRGVRGLRGRQRDRGREIKEGRVDGMEENVNLVKDKIRRTGNVGHHTHTPGKYSTFVRAFGEISKGVSTTSSL